LPWLVDVAPGEPVKLADPHSGRVEHKKRQPVAGGEETHDSFHVLGARRAQLAPLFAWKLHRQPIPRGVRRDAAVVEQHRQHGDGLADRLLLEPGRVELGDEIGDGLRIQPVYGLIPKLGKNAAERHPVGLERAGGDVDTRRLPALGELPNCRGALTGETQVRSSQRRELAGDPVPADRRLTLCPEAAPVAGRALTAANAVLTAVPLLAGARNAGCDPATRHRLSPQ
jgi:hypothetical protein